MNTNYKYELTFVTVDFPFGHENDYLDIDDFDSHRSVFEGDNMSDALLNGLQLFGYINKKNYMDASMSMDFDSIIHFIGLDDTKLGNNGDEKDFILFIEDERGNIVFEDERGFSEWKSSFRIMGENDYE